jgi:uncharacterized membrane protein
MLLLGRIFVGIAMVAFGVQHLVYGKFVTRVVPRLPPSIPWHPFWAYLTGAVLIAAGAAIILQKRVRPVAILLGILILCSALFLAIPLVVASPSNGGLWTNAGKAFALAGAAFLVAGFPAGRFFLSAFLILTGIQHFIYAPFVQGLVPAWIPEHLFWTYFAGVALIAGGIGMIIPRTTRLAAYLSGLMIFLWVILLHIPRAMAAPRDSNETTAVFEALAISGAALLAAKGNLTTKRAVRT